MGEAMNQPSADRELVGNINRMLADGRARGIRRPMLSLAARGRLV